MKLDQEVQSFRDLRDQESRGQNTYTSDRNKEGLDILSISSVITHAMGGYNGNIYLNCLEGIK